MADATLVFPPGYRVTDDSGDVVSGATIEFYDAGTTDDRTVYSDVDLSSSLGTTVYCDSSGAPVASSGSSTRVNIYTGTGNYKVIIKDGSGAEIETKDNLLGALNTTPFTAGAEALPTFPVVAKSSDYTVVDGDQANIINVNPTAATRTITLPSAVTVGDNWCVGIRHVGTANNVSIATVSSQTISAPLAGGAQTSMQLVSYGDSIILVSDGANWHVPMGYLGLKLGSGYHTNVYDNGTVSSGTLTLDPEESNFHKVVFSGDCTLGVPSEDCNIILQATMATGISALTTSSFTVVSGDSLTYTNGDDFFLNITVVDSFSRLFVEALQ